MVNTTFVNIYIFLAFWLIQKWSIYKNYQLEAVATLTPNWSTQTVHPKLGQPKLPQPNPHHPIPGMTLPGSWCHVWCGWVIRCVGYAICMGTYTLKHVVPSVAATRLGVTWLRKSLLRLDLKPWKSSSRSQASRLGAWVALEQWVGTHLDTHLSGHIKICQSPSKPPLLQPSVPCCLPFSFWLQTSTWWSQWPGCNPRVIMHQNSEHSTFQRAHNLLP